MAVSGNQFTRIGAAIAGVAKKLVILAKEILQPASPDCYVTFIGTITDEPLADAVFIGTLTETKTLIGALDVKDGAFIGTLTDENALIGNICND